MQKISFRKKEENVDLLQFAIAGNPNCGKTTLFNSLTGSNAHVGNWPGVTVDKKVGIYKKLEENIELLDLPGIYSLSPYTPEEVIARNVVLGDDIDCIINIVDATCLERNLYLTTQILELDKPVVVALNMMDIMERSGYKIDIEALEKSLGVPVVPISALRKKGMKELMAMAYATSKVRRRGVSALEQSALREIFHKTVDLYRADNQTNVLFRATKMIDEDELEIAENPEIAKKVEKLKKNIDLEQYDQDFSAAIADIRYDYIVNYFSAHIIKVESRTARSEKIDKVLTHKIWGIPIFLAIMFLVFHITFSENFLFLGAFIPEGSFDVPIIGEDSIASPGAMLLGSVEYLTELISDAVSGAMPEGVWYTGLVVDGLFAGVFAVLSFVPQILMLFFFLSLLEDTGYMARVAFITDRAFKRFGLSGKALMPLLMCFGCAVPGILGTRTLGTDAERRRTIYLTPFFSCGAKLPIWAAFAGAFAAKYASLPADVTVFTIYLIGIVVAIVAAIFLKKSVIKGEAQTFIMELPNYNRPQMKSVFIHLWEKLKHYVYRATTIIAGAVIVLWFLTSFSFKMEYLPGDDASILGIISKWLSVLFVPLGWGMGANGWKFLVASLTGTIAKEMVVASLGTLAGGGTQEALDALLVSIGGNLGSLNVAIPAMFSYLAFNLLTIPCAAAIAVARTELMVAENKKKGRLYFWGAILFWILTAYVVSLIIFWFGVLAVYKAWLAAIVGIIIGLAIVIYAMYKGGVIDQIRQKLAAKKEIK